MANLKLKNPAGGSLNLVSADGASDLTVTFPATTGTAMVSGNMPAFSAWLSGGNQSLTSGTWIKITFNTEECLQILIDLNLIKESDILFDVPQNSILTRNSDGSN